MKSDVNTKALRLWSAIVLAGLATVGGCDCGTVPPSGVDAAADAGGTADAGGDGGTIVIDAAAGDSGGGQDSAGGADAAGDDAAGDDAAAADAGTAGDATVAEDAAPALDAAAQDDAAASADAAGGADVLAVNQPPSVQIAAPASGSTFHTGDTIDLTGTATDPEDGALAGAALSWSSDVDGVLGTGAAVSNALTTTGDHRITLVATDSQGASASASILLHVVDNLPPLVDITDPADPSTFARGETIRFRCDATDAEDGAVSNANIVWSSDLGGPIGIGAAVTTGLTTVGTHVITCTATDSQGASASASISLEILPNNAPLVTIAQPADGAYFLPTDSIAFQGSALDPEDGALGGGFLVWTANGGALGTSGMVTTALPLGDHVIRLTATDSQGATGSDTITVHVVDNLPPRCTITQPADGETRVEGASVTFTVACSNPDGSPVNNVDVRWSSDLDGQIGFGFSVTNALITVGDHTITMCAKDPADATVQTCLSRTVHVVVNQPPAATISRPQDGASIAACTLVGLRCNATDPEGASLTFTWTSSVDGELAITRNLDWTPASSGPHRLTCIATDAQGKSGSAFVDIVIDSPSVGILHPADGEIRRPGTQVPFVGEACDVEDGALTGSSLVWVSSRDGQIGTGTTFQLNTLSTGPHTITLTATDGDGNTGTASIDLWINSAPTVTITSPTSGSSFGTGTTVHLTGTSSDAEDAAPPVITWSDSAAGTFGSGDSADLFNPTLGKHRVTASVTDGVGETATASIDVLITDGTPLLGSVAGFGFRVASVTPDPNSGGWWVASSGGLYLWDGTNPTTLYTTGNSDLPDNNVRAVAVLANDTLLIATADGLAVCASPGAGQTGTPDNCNVWDNNNGPLPFDTASMTALLELDDGRVLIGTSSCLVFWDRVNDASRDYCQNDGGGDGLRGDNIRALVWDPTSAQVWIATTNGVSLLTLAAQGVIDRGAQDFVDVTQSDGLASNEVRAIAVAPSGLVWFACSAGLTVLERASGADTFTTYTTADGLPANSVRDVAIDVVDIGGTSHEVAWAATSGGLGRVDHALPSVLSITQADGLSSNDLSSVDVGAAHIKYVGVPGGMDLYRGL